MFKFPFIISVFLAFLHLIHGNVFTDPSKLARLAKFQMSIKNIISAANTEELATLPKELLVELTR